MKNCAIIQNAFSPLSLWVFSPHEANVHTHIFLKFHSQQKLNSSFIYALYLFRLCSFAFEWIIKICNWLKKRHAEPFGIQLPVVSTQNIFKDGSGANTSQLESFFVKSELIYHDRALERVSYLPLSKSARMKGSNVCSTCHMKPQQEDVFLFAA